MLHEEGREHEQTQQQIGAGLTVSSDGVPETFAASSSQAEGSASVDDPSTSGKSGRAG